MDFQGISIEAPAKFVNRLRATRYLLFGEFPFLLHNNLLRQQLKEEFFGGSFSLDYLLVALISAKE